MGVDELSRDRTSCSQEVLGPIVPTPSQAEGASGRTVCVASGLGLAGGSAMARIATRPAGPAVHVTLTTVDLRHALASMPPLNLGIRPPRLPVIGVDDTVRFQRVRGFGAAMTDSSAWLLYLALAPSLRAKVMQQLFGRAGIDLNFERANRRIGLLCHRGSLQL
jgi:hypothetical protein